MSVLHRRRCRAPDRVCRSQPTFVRKASVDAPTSPRPPSHQLAGRIPYGRSVADTSFDAEKLRVLQEWGAGLQGDPRAEVAAAGRAILMLVEEVERLHVLVWDRRLYPQDVTGQSAGGEADERQRNDLAFTLRQRLRLRREATFQQSE